MKSIIYLDSSDLVDADMLYALIMNESVEIVYAI